MAYATTQLMNTRCISAISAAIFLAAGLPSVANAAFYDGTDTLISGQASFSSSSSQTLWLRRLRRLFARLISRFRLFPADKFFYCYQIFNSSDSSRHWQIHYRPGFRRYRLFSRLFRFSQKAISIPARKYRRQLCRIFLQLPIPNHRRPQLICAVLRR